MVSAIQISLLVVVTNYCCLYTICFASNHVNMFKTHGLKGTLPFSNKIDINSNVHVYKHVLYTVVVSYDDDDVVHVSLSENHLTQTEHEH